MGMSVSFTMDEETSVPPEESRVILNGDTSASLTRETMDELTSGETLALFTGERWMRCLKSRNRRQTNPSLRRSSQVGNVTRRRQVAKSIPL